MKDLIKKQLVKKAARSAAPMLKKVVKKDPRVAAALWAVEWATGRKSKSTRRMGLAARGLAAAAVALPIGLLVGYRMRSAD